MRFSQVILRADTCSVSATRARCEDEAAGDFGYQGEKSAAILTR